VCPESCDGLAGESPVGVMAKQPRSWWPAEGETRPSKRHDKGALGVEQVTGPQHQANPAASLPLARCCRAQAGAEPGLRGRRPWKASRSWSAASRNPSAYGEWNGCTARHGTGEIRLGTGISWPQGAILRCLVTVTPISSDPAKWRSAERKSEEAVVAATGMDNTTAGSEGPPAGWASLTAGRPRGLPWGYQLRSPQGDQGPVRAGGCLGGRQRGGDAECGWPTARGKAG
jgi:hypothetical protein